MNRHKTHWTHLQQIRSVAHRVVVDGYTLHDASVLSGVPLGTVLGPFLFLMFINDITENMSSRIRLFADVCLMYHEIRSQSDCHRLQDDLNRLMQWSKIWGMAFNIKKCNIISITNNTIRKIRHQYTMNSEPVNPINTCVYYIVTVNSRLHWNDHIDKISAAANRMSGFLRQTLYKCN